MEHIDLYELISCLEYKTNIHICVVFLNRFGNYKTALPHGSTIHSKPFCDRMKLDRGGLEKCIKCRNLALKKAAEGQVPFGGFCFNGVYEYCYPIVREGKTAAVIFVGNILRDDSPMQKELADEFEDTFEVELPEEKCITICRIIEEHINILLCEYSEKNPDYDPLVENLRNYIKEFTYSDISVASIASAFNYSEKYIGKRFKARTGMTIHEYINEKRLEKAVNLLESTDMSVTDIASAVGFNNVTYFNKVFKEKYALSPTQYRKKDG